CPEQGKHRDTDYRESQEPAMKLRISETDVNRLAQTYYSGGGPCPRMTDKPQVVQGLKAVFAELGIEVVPAPVDLAVSRATELIAASRTDIVRAALTLLGVARVTEMDADK